jgi:hypothetical protein
VTVLLSLVLVTSSAPAGPDQSSGGSKMPSPYSAWKNGPSADPGFFPLAVWLQDPANAEPFRAIGINTYVGLWEGPTDEQLARLTKAGMRVICDQNEVGLRHRDDPIIIGWMHGDEPDNYQGTAEGGYGPAIPPSKIVAEYQEYRRRDPTRPVMLNLGQGVANEDFKGVYATLSDYPEYMKGADIVSYDVYPVAGIEKPNGADYLWYVAKGMDRMTRWGEGRKVLWNALECTRISNLEAKPTPHQVKAEVWMSIIHGSMGIIYFVHQFRPTFVEAALLADKEMSAAVKAVNEQVLSLAPVLNSPTIPDGGSATTDSPVVPVDLMVKRQGDTVYLFAVGMRNAAVHANLRVDALRKMHQNGTAEVIGENRTIPIWGGGFEDDFGAYDVHIYKVALPPPAPVR